MLQHVRSRRRSDQGFTLIELLVVIVILGVLAAIVVFSVVGVTDRGKKAACQADLTTATNAVEAYYAQSSDQTYPASLAAISTGTKKFLNSTPSDVTYTPAADLKSYTIGYASGAGC